MSRAVPLENSYPPAISISSSRPPLRVVHIRLGWLGGIADSLMLRAGGCSGCQLAGTCRVCPPLAKQFQEAKAPLAYYCQHEDKDRRSA